MSPSTQNQAMNALVFLHRQVLDQPPDGMIDVVRAERADYFDAGFPHGQSQFSSFNGTCWATMALLLAVEPRKAGQVAAR